MHSSSQENRKTRWTHANAALLLAPSSAIATSTRVRSRRQCVWSAAFFLCSVLPSTRTRIGFSSPRKGTFSNSRPSASRSVCSTHSFHEAALFSSWGTASRNTWKSALFKSKVTYKDPAIEARRREAPRQCASLHSQGRIARRERQWPPAPLSESHRQSVPGRPSVRRPHTGKAGAQQPHLPVGSLRNGTNLSCWYASTALRTAPRQPAEAPSPARRSCRSPPCAGAPTFGQTR
eukprot:1191127-Prorocentrum_minimum.AAC.1